ncbi:MAG: glycosyltransferase family 2 protein [Planctomycetota bacterium]
MIPVTATIITFNEESNIRDCLESVKWCPHIVVVDSGSTDRTVEIAREYTDRVIVTDWPGHVQQKNRAVDLAPTDWILSLDADERVTPEARAEAEKVLEAEPIEAGFSFRRKTRYLGRWILHGGWYPDRKVRLFDRRRARWGGINPHDHVHADGPTVALDGDLLHYTYRDMEHHLRTIDFFTDIAAREKDVRGDRRPLLGMLTRPPSRFFRMYILKRGYRDGFAGFVIAGLGAIYVFLKYAKLWERRDLRARGLDPDGAPRNRRGPEWAPPRKAPVATGEEE